MQKIFSPTVQTLLTFTLMVGMVGNLVVPGGLALPVFAQSPSPSSSTKTVASPSPTPNPEDNTPVAPASSPLNLTISPISLPLETDPGEAKVHEIKIRNNSSQAERLSINLATFSADETGQKAKLRDMDANDPSAAWMEYPKESFIVQPNEWKSINIRFNPPKDAALAYYYALVFSRTNKLTSAPGQTVVNVSSALLILANVRSPNTVKKLDLSKFAVTQPIAEFLPQTFKVTIKNAGNTHVAPTGNVFIDSARNKDIAVLSLNHNNGMILPNSERTYEVRWTDGFPVSAAYADDIDPSTPEKEKESGFNLLGMHFNLSKADRFRIGPYTANLLMVYDNGEKDIPVESKLSFWVLPWRLLLLLAIQPTLLIVFIIVIVRLSRRSSGIRVAQKKKKK